MAAILNFLKGGDWEVDDDNSKPITAAHMKGSDIVNTLTSLCNSKNGGIHYCDQIVFGLEGAVIKKEKSFQRHYNGNIGRVYLLDHEGDHNGYKVGWVLDDAFSDCMICAEPFEFLSRGRHHCRSCGMLVCDECSRDKAAIAQLSDDKGTTWRVCDLCVAQHPPDEVWDLNKTKI
jgi:hypothetical protein